MKKLIFILSSLWVVTLLPAQEITVNGKLTNYILYSSLEIYKIGDPTGKKDAIKIDQLHIDSKFEKLTGKQYKKDVIHNDMSYSRNFERVSIPGLVLNLPEDKRSRDVEFTLTTPEYHIILENGQELYVGMSADQFSTIFPLSWADRSTVTADNGKYELGVLLAFKQNGEILATDEIIYLVFDKKTLKVERISYHIRP